MPSLHPPTHFRHNLVERGNKRWKASPEASFCWCTLSLGQVKSPPVPPPGASLAPPSLGQFLVNPWSCSCQPCRASPRAGDSDTVVTFCFGRGLSPSWTARKGGLCSLQVEFQRRKHQARPYHCELSSFVLEDLRLRPHCEHHGPLLPRAHTEPEAASTESPWRASPHKRLCSKTP